MNRVAIIYHSEHHLNTKKLLDAIEKKYKVDLISLPDNNVDLTKYAVVGFASGIYMSKLHPSIWDFLKENLDLLADKSSFVICTSGSKNKKYIEGLNKYLNENRVKVLGSFHCHGYDTYGPFKLVGGINKGHPTKEDLVRVLQFFEKTVLLS